MTIAIAKLSDPTVRAAVAAINAGDRAAFVALLTEDATMSDDGSDRDLADWIDREIFSSRGHMDVQSEADGGRALIANYSNETWGEMRTAWRFVVDGNRISRFETGQA
ncbi:nuclear transport factor 2 family protein [Kitasatospora sp. NPDC058218]|uniref:nuclear transport factor 2 family protein n=1 Tax=Kitasatospora sp. NPDC058218 TaxID=3346385 RepID=UPI0036D75EF2